VERLLNSGQQLLQKQQLIRAARRPINTAINQEQPLNRIKPAQLVSIATLCGRPPASLSFEISIPLSHIDKSLNFICLLLKDW